MLSEMQNFDVQTKYVLIWMNRVYWNNTLMCKLNVFFSLLWENTCCESKMAPILTSEWKKQNKQCFCMKIQINVI